MIHSQRVKAIIFDCDGVLVDSEVIAHHVLIQELANYPSHIIDQINPDYIASLQGLTTEAVVMRLNEEYELAMTEDVIVSIEQKVRLALLNKLPLITGVKSAILKISDYNPSIQYAVASNSMLPHIQRSVVLQKIETIIGCNMISRSMVSEPKPAPDVYLKAAEMLNVLPEYCVVVEDSITGATAGLAAGMRVIGFMGASHLPDMHEQSLLELGVSMVIHDMSDLPNAILTLSE